ncbi:M17 family peptidase N-terminal domain-containing protein [Actinokineospora bangkokensis]|uniref:Probable cytosol aminopeptidase n=1 Tax=Actinokineospora bangkokensis TaxID=1193682 RepID=A0A1Q9LKN4_9PSEU|nr:hypothetical protein BJP25_21070 [Actinokineospora bangkokensis]
MSIEWDLVRRLPATAAAAVVPVFAGEGAEQVSAEFLGAVGFGGGVGQVLVVPGLGRAEVLVGLGPRERVDGGVVRAAVAEAVRAVRVGSLAVVVPEGVAGPVGVRAVVEGVLLGGYRFGGYRGDSGDVGVQRVDIVVEESAEARAALAVGQVLGSGVLLARDLVNGFGGLTGPEGFVERAWAISGETGVGCEVWDAHRIVDEGLGGLGGVGFGGGARGPRLVRLTHAPEGALGSVALVGNGVVSGAGRRGDMAGAAVVLAAVSALAVLDCPLRVEAWLPVASSVGEGASGGRVGEVVRLRGGTGVEVLSGGVEGQLVMADVLALAAEGAPGAVVDVAALSPAVGAALGEGVAAVQGTSAGLVESVRWAGGRAGETVWPLPVPSRGGARRVGADVVAGERRGSAVEGGGFLSGFVPAGVPWAHVDIHGVAVAGGDRGGWVRGATGFGVRTLVELLMAPLAV